MGFWRSAAGMVCLELTSADVARALDEINEAGIEIRNAVPTGNLTVCFSIRRTDWRRLKQLQLRKGNTLKLLHRSGIYWSGKRLLHRPMLLLGLIMLILFALFVPSRVYFVRVEGNVTVPERLILEAAAESGIRFGASRRDVRSEKMKNRLLSALPQLQWAGVNTYGCVAVISVRERNIPDEHIKSDEVASIVASRDGVILSCTATRGDLLCVPGQAVREGDILISGFTDCGLTVTAARADGEILAQTTRNLTILTPTDCQIQGSIRSKRTKYSLIIGKKRINFYKGSGIWGATCDKIETEYHLTLPGGFQLPVTLVREDVVSYDLADAERQNADTLLAHSAESYLRRTMVAGTIIGADTRITGNDGAKCLTGTYACTEMIGKIRREIGEYNGKTS